MTTKPDLRGAKVAVRPEGVDRLLHRQALGRSADGPVIDASGPGADNSSASPKRPRTASPSERTRVGMWLPPPVLLGAALALGTLAQCLFVGSFNVTPVRAAIGCAVVLCSLFAIGSCILCFKRVGTPFRPVSPATMIVQSGLYRLSRNPMYVGMAGILLGSGLVLGSSALAAAVAPFVLIVHVGVVLPEERYLEQLHGEPYRNYKRTVRRWL